MKTKQNNSKAFTIIELLTVMSIIVVLIGLLVPALSRVRRFSMDLKQRAQLHSIEAALTLFLSENEEFPESKADDALGQPYGGAMKLCEALMGQDLMGFHPDSRFLLNGTDGRSNPIKIYEPGIPNLEENLDQRPEGTSLPEDNANAYRLSSIYSSSDLSSSVFSGTEAVDKFVLCDVFKKVENLGNIGESKIGMPILYYKANTSGQFHDPNTAQPTRDSNNNFIYNVYDNQDIVAMGKPWETSTDNKYHAMDAIIGSGLEKFYDMTTNKQIQINSSTAGMSKRPYKSNTFILISAGFDGEYGTADDITNYSK